VGKGLSVLNKGIERQLALVEMGQTAVTENGKDERKFGTFAFVHGQHGTVKAETWEGSCLQISQHLGGTTADRDVPALRQLTDRPRPEAIYGGSRGARQ
jgi:hypothetical protein